MMEDFSIFTALKYIPPPSSPGLPLLAQHIQRLRTAHAELAKQLPFSWCNSVQFPSEERIKLALEDCVKTGGESNPQRIRLVIGHDGIPQATSTPLLDNPPYPVRLVLDSQPTDYSSPFLYYKTTNRSVYDDARTRNKATLIASENESDPPFDVLLCNANLELTETSIANCAFCLDPSTSKEFITPSLSCGLLEGVQRAELLRLGEIVEGVVTVEQLRIASKAGTLQILNFNAVRGTYSATLVSLVEALDRRTLKPDYSKTSTSGIDLMEQATAPPALQLILQSLAHHSNKEGEVIMLDNACGAGIVSKCILEMQLEKAGRKLEVVAGDFEPKMVGLMQARIEKNAWSAKAMVVDAQAIPFPDSYFTHVATNFAIQLLPDSVLALKESHRVLRKGGITSFTSWTKLGWLPTIQLADPSFATPAVTTGLWATPSFLTSTLLSLGFDDVKITPYDFICETRNLEGYMDGMKGFLGNVVKGEVEGRLRKLLEDERVGGDGIMRFSWAALIVSAVKV